MAVSKAKLHVVSTNGERPPGAGRATAVEELYCVHRAAVANYIARMLPGGQQDAEVILQETYIRLLRLENLQPLRANPRAYIFTVATNLARDSLRRHIRRRADYHDRFDDREHESGEQTPHASAEWQQSMQQLKQSLLQLKPVTRKVFLLSRFEEMTYPEIAAALSISTRSVERHMSTALQYLQRELNEFL